MSEQMKSPQQVVSVECFNSHTARQDLPEALSL